MASRKATDQKAKAKGKNFSSFSLDEALTEAGVEKLLVWQMETKAVMPSEVFYASLDRLKRFDTRRNERGRELIIDAIFAEALFGFERLKVWKGAPLGAKGLTGEADYLITRDRDYFAAPFLCAVEAKKDDFEKGLAQCLVEMKACWLNNLELNRRTEVFGIVTNGTGWKFYRWVRLGEVYETVMYGEHEMSMVLGALHQVLQMCDALGAIEDSRTLGGN
jgi:hypothetical protein